MCVCLQSRWCNHNLNIYVSRNGKASKTRKMLQVYPYICSCNPSEALELKKRYQDSSSDDLKLWRCKGSVRCDSTASEMWLHLHMMAGSV